MLRLLDCLCPHSLVFTSCVCVATPAGTCLSSHSTACRCMAGLGQQRVSPLAPISPAAASLRLGLTGLTAPSLAAVRSLAAAAAALITRLMRPRFACTMPASCCVRRRCGTGRPSWLPGTRRCPAAGRRGRTCCLGRCCSYSQRPVKVRQRVACLNHLAQCLPSRMHTRILIMKER